jgi:membrane fusion protein (multidrug efflux system)
MPPMPVDVATAVQDTAIDEITATGAIEAIQSIELRPEVDGRIVEIYVREGVEVSRGRALFKVDDAELTAQVARLEAERDLAAQALARARALLAEDATSQAELEGAEARARSSQADLDLTQLRLDRTVVRAPFAGVVGERLVSLGDYVTSATRLVTLQTVNPQRAAFEVPERYAERLAVGQQVKFGVAAVRGRTFTGNVDFVDPSVRFPARTILVKAVVPNRERVLQAGMFIEARLATEVRPDAVMIPEDAILPLEMGFFVWVVTPEGQATRREVELGIRAPGRVEILSGVEIGEQVVTGGLERLSEGAPVMPRQPIQGELVGQEGSPGGEEQPAGEEEPSPEGEPPGEPPPGDETGD